jgi:hypothetical protein
MAAPGRRGRARAERLRALLDAGDLRRAADEARQAVADPALAPADREAAEEALARATPEPAAVVVGAVGVAIAAAVAARVLLGP